MGALLEHRHLQQQLLEIQRLALLGNLTRALVHEVNHQLGPIGFALSDLKEQCKHIMQTIGDLNNVKNQLHSAQNILQDLANSINSLVKTTKVFSRITIKNQRQVLRLDTLIEETIYMVKDTANQANISINFQPPLKLILIHTQMVQVQHILLNILLNAIQQIKNLRSDVGGQIQINLELDDDERAKIVQIHIKDDGPGIHRRYWNRIFDLGFTQGRQDGSGLGLYITRSLINTIGGRVYVADSRILWGTTFVVELPLFQPGEVQ